jgi:hypothetical protein
MLESTTSLIEGGEKMAKSQNMEVLEHMRTHNGITTYEAFELYGITRLASRICDLRNMGHKIKKVSRNAVDRRGKKTCFTEYQLME